MSFRVGIVGARRRSQGIGEHVARHLAGAGADVTAIVGTRPATLSEARRNLADHWGLEVNGYLSLSEMLRAEELDAVAICSPREFHLAQLQECSEAGVHVLCEKPLVFNPPSDPAALGKPLVESFENTGRVLMAVEQWPYTLSSFARIYPEGGGVPHRAVRELQMWLAPGAAGPDMIPNALPHVLSLLLALAPAGGQAREISVDAATGGDAADAMEIRFDYEHRDGCTSVRVSLTRVDQQPRPAGYAIDGKAVRRVVENPGYRMFFETAAGEGQSQQVQGAMRRLPIPDPLELLATDFVGRCTRGNGGGAGVKLIESLRILGAVYAAATKWFPEQGVKTWTKSTISTTSAAS